jgi:hypothetical protein
MSMIGAEHSRSGALTACEPSARRATAAARFSGMELAAILPSKR